MEYWSDGVLEWWSGGVVEYWNDGVMEYWSIVTEGSDFLFPVLGISYIM